MTLRVADLGYERVDHEAELHIPFRLSSTFGVLAGAAPPSCLLVL